MASGETRILTQLLPHSYSRTQNKLLHVLLSIWLRGESPDVDAHILEPTLSLHTLVRDRAAFCLSLLPGLTLLVAEEKALCLSACSPRLATGIPKSSVTGLVCRCLLMSEGGAWTTFLSQEN